MDSYVKNLNKKEAANRLGISEATLNRMLAKDEISHVQIGRRIFFTEQHLFELVERKTRQVKNAASAIAA